MATGWKNPTKTFSFNDPEWATGRDPETGEEIKSYWIFRTDVTDEDRDKIREMASRVVYEEISERERRQAIRDGTIDQLIRDHMHEEVLMSTRRATLLQMSKGWTGPEFVLPDDFTTVVHDVKTGEEREVPHPLAGQPAPYTAAFIGLRDPDQLDSMFKVLNAIWAGRSPEEQKSFRDERGSVLSTGFPQRGAGEDPVSVATDSVLESPGATELQPAGS